MKIVYPGTFDPFTRGHADLVQRAQGMFDTVIVAVADGANKSPILPFEKRIDLVRTSLQEHNNIEVCGFDGLLVDFIKQQKVNIVLRGLRAVSDFEYEFQLAAMNRRLWPAFESVFLMPSEEFAFVSSSLVWEIAKLGGDISMFVVAEVEQAVQSACQESRG